MKPHREPKPLGTRYSLSFSLSLSLSLSFSVPMSTCCLSALLAPIGSVGAQQQLDTAEPRLGETSRESGGEIGGEQGGDRGGGGGGGGGSTADGALRRGGWGAGGC